jgi:hypothetical protein
MFKYYSDDLRLHRAKDVCKIQVLKNFCNFKYRVFHLKRDCVFNSRPI